MLAERPEWLAGKGASRCEDGREARQFWEFWERGLIIAGRAYGAIGGMEYPEDCGSDYPEVPARGLQPVYRETRADGRA
jgi:hypothetical protein